VTRRLTVEADGGSRGNPGVAGYGALVRDGDTGALLAERAEPLGKASNNVAEYRGLIAGLEAALAIDPGAHVLARMDSKLVVEQMSGRWKIKHEDMRRLALQARDVAAQIVAAGGAVRYEWIPREINKDADALSNVAMDGHTVDRTFDGTQDVEVADDAEAGESEARGSEEVAEPGIPVRVVLVAAAASQAGAGATASAVASLVGGGATSVVRAGTDAVSPTAAAVGNSLGAEPEVDPAWDAAGRGAVAAWDRVVARGGTVVVVCPADVVRVVLAHLLGVPSTRRERIAVAAGSLAGVEAWDDGRVSVAFTNRT
jgi:ribonuclease H / adenosylcobalamin/alpha-ribazole phosphatase